MGNALPEESVGNILSKKQFLFWGRGEVIEQIQDKEYGL